MTSTASYVPLLLTARTILIGGACPQVVGSPANWQTHLQGWSVHMNLNTQPSTSPHFITEDVWNDVLAPEVMRQCDALDGVRAVHIRSVTVTPRRPSAL